MSGHEQAPQRGRRRKRPSQDAGETAPHTHPLQTLQRDAGNAAVTAELQHDADERSPVLGVIGRGGGKAATTDMERNGEGNLGANASDSRTGVGDGGRTRQGMMLAAGNSANAALIESSRSTPLHPSPTVASIQREPADATQAEAAAAAAAAQALSANLWDVFADLDDTLRDGGQAAKDSQASMESTASMYGGAKNLVEGVLTNAKASFAITDTIKDVVTDTILGLLIGPNLGALAVDLGASALLSEGLQDAAESVASKVLGFAEAKSLPSGLSLPLVGGREARDNALQLPPASEELKRIGQYKELLGTYDRLLQLTSSRGRIADLRHWADVVEGDAKVLASGGHSSTSISDVKKAIAALDDALKSARRVQATATAASSGFLAMRDAAKAAVPVDSRKAQQDLWLEYIAALPDASRHDILDKIEGPLEEIGVLSKDDKAQGVLKADFGDYTSEDDTRHAGLEAKALSEHRYKAARGFQLVGKQGTLASVNKEDRTATATFAGMEYYWNLADVNIPETAQSVEVSVGQSVVITSWDPETQTHGARLIV